jgi:predicted glycosyltransferase involved in capsule biosynthesis
MDGDGLSLVFPIMNRTHVLIQSIPTWLESKSFDELIIVDWSSKIPIYDDPLVKQIIEDSRVKIIRVENETSFISLSFALNLGISKASNTNILKLDIDYKLINLELFNFIDTIKPLLKSSFFITEPQYCKITISIVGFILLNKNHFFNVNGYNENLKGWGYEDSDLYIRLSRLVQKNLLTDLDDYIFHIPHEDSLKIENYVDKETPIGDNERMNRIRARVFPCKKPSTYKTIDIVYNNNKVKYELVERIK